MAFSSAFWPGDEQTYLWNVKDDRKETSLCILPTFIHSTFNTYVHIENTRIPVPELNSVSMSVFCRAQSMHTCPLKCMIMITIDAFGQLRLARCFRNKLLVFLKRSTSSDKGHFLVF